MNAVLDTFRLDGRVALVTGGARGLGLEIARALAQAGASVALTSRDEGRAREAAAGLAAETGRKVLGLAADVRDAASVAAMAERTRADLGGPDILVNNAGLTRRGALGALAEADWDEVLDANLKGAWLAARAVVPAMRGKRWGRIVNVASMLALAGLPERSPYVASKGGMLALTRALAVELAPDGVTVNALCPGPFRTAMHDPVARAGLKEAIPLGRFGEPGEIGPAALFLASEASSFVTGAVLSVDGGYTAR